MNIESIVFYFFASLTIIAAFGVIIAKNAVQAVLSLVLAFFCAAAIWMLLEAEFLAITLVLVYVGAVMVLFLFVVMMLDVDYAALKQGFTRQLPLGLALAIVLFGAIFWVLKDKQFSTQTMPEPAKHEAGYSNIKMLGNQLYSEYFYAFEIAGVILLVAIIAAISLTFRGRRERRGQSVPQQQKVSKDDRLRIIKMDSEKPVSAKDEVTNSEQES